MKIRTLHRTTVINKPREDVFRFFSTPGNLNLITPPAFAMRIIRMSKPEIR